MVFNTEKGTHVENSVGTSDEFQIKADEKLFMLLSDSVYADKTAAGIREITCNAFDAHVEAGQTRKFQVTIPSHEKPEFRVRDFGKGLAPDQMTMYTTYGDSSKEGSNAYIGAFGIGAKSPFAYTNTFNVTSYYEGKAYYYTMFVENGKPRKTLLAECETDEPSGLEVFYAVKLSDIDEFRSKSLRILKWMKDRVEVLNAESYWLSDLENSNTDWSTADYLGQNFGEIDLTVSDKSWGSDLKVVQGNVLYTISQDEYKEAFESFVEKEDSGSFKVKENLPRNVCFEGFIKVPNGTFMPQPSRERLSFTPETKEKLGSILCLTYRHKVVDSINDMFRQAQNSYLKLYNLWVSAPTIIKNHSKFDNLHFKGYLNHLAFKDWAKSLVKNVRCVKIANHCSQASVVLIKETTVAAIISNDFPIFSYWDGAYLSFEKKCRILENLGTPIQVGPVAYILFRDSTAFLSEEDLKAIKNVNDLPKSSVGVQTRWKSNAAVSTSALTTISLPGGGVQRTSRIFDDTNNPTQSELDYTFWIPADKAYKVEFEGQLYDFEYKKGRSQFADRYGLVVERYVSKHVEETNESFYGTARVLLLPEKHPYRNILPKFEDIIVEGAKAYIDSYEANLEWNTDYSSEQYIPFIKELFAANLITRIGLEQETLDRLTAWSKSNFKVGKRLRPFVSMDHIKLDATYQAKVQSILQSTSTNAYSIELKSSIVYPLYKKYPLVKLLEESYSARRDSGIISDLIEYLELKLSKAATEESSEEKSA